MKKIVLLIFLLINLSGFAQSYYCTKNITLTDCKVNFINNVPSKWAQLDATLMTWSIDQVGSYIIKDGVTQVTIKNDGCLISPTFANLDDSLIAWQSRCLSSGGATIPIPLLVDNIGIDTVRVLDSVRVWFEQGLDTSNQGILNGIFGILRDSLDKNVFINNDSLRVYFNQILDTSNSGVLLAIHNLLKDSLDKNIFVNNDSLRVYFNDAPFVSDTANQSVLLSIHNLLKDSLDKNLYIQNDSLKVWFSQPLEVKTDTANQSVLNAILQTLVDSLDKTIYILNDSLRVYFNQISDTANNAILNAIYNTLVDSLDKQLYVLNPYIDSAIVRRMDTIIDRLTTTEKLDTLKGLVYTAIAKVRTNRDTLFNCKSLSFGRKSGASGTLVLTYENG